MNVPFNIREGEANDLNFILSTWLRSYKNSKYGKSIHEDIYYKYQQEKIKKLLKNCETLVACEEKDDSHILGYICFDPSMITNICVLHYVYIKKAFREFGIASGLIIMAKRAAQHNLAMPLIVTHDTSAFQRAHKIFYAFNPYLLGN